MKGNVLMAMSRHDDGGFADTCDDLLKRIIHDVTRYGGNGKLTINMGISPNGDNGLEVTFEAKAALPKRVQGKAFYYPTLEHDLSRVPPKDEGDMLMTTITKGEAG